MARRRPNAIAVDVPPGPGRPSRRTISYGELKGHSERLALAIHQTVGERRIVAILLPRTSERIYLAQIAVLRAGSAYVCLDPQFPDQQLAHILRDSSTAVLIADADGAERARRSGYTGPVIRLDQPLPVVQGRLPRQFPPDSLAYIIYTSGTTGRPKGIMIAHHSVCALIRSDVEAFALGPGDRVAQGSSAAYDSSVEEVWMALASGATVVVMDDEAARLGPDLVPWLRRERVTMLCPPPTLLRTTGCEDPQRELPDLRLLYVGGEALPPDIAERWGRGRRLVNGYGPTECTVVCLRAEIMPGRPIAIGRPIPGMQAWALDENLRPVAAGKPGELCMAGAGLAVGYLNMPQLNATKFPLHPRLGRIFRTGDLVHLDADGNFYYHGRIDSQVKLRGYRIELEAIEAVLARCPGVREAACRVQGEGAGEALAAHIVPVRADAPPPVEELKLQLRDQLPAYAVPALFGTLDELPRSTGGKLRRTHLPTLAAPKRAAQPGGDVASTELERYLARAVQEVLELAEQPSIDADFFDLGGTSLLAAMLITTLRADPAGESVTVRDLYECRTVRALARRVQPAGGPGSAPDEGFDGGAPVPQPKGNPVGVTLAQSAWILLELLIAGPLAYLAVFKLLPWVSQYIALIPLIVALSVLAVLARPLLTFVSVTILVIMKKLIIGRYTPMRVPVWSAMYFRMWVVQHLARLVPWGLLAGTEFECVVLRALGARIGKRVHIHRGVDLHQGGWDLLHIGDDVTISQDAGLHLVRLEEGHVVVGPITLGDGATLDIRAGMAPNSRAGRNSWLSPLSSLPAGGVIPDGELWDGVPARRVGPAPTPPTPTRSARSLPPVLHGMAMIFIQNVVGLILSVPAILVAVWIVLSYNLDYNSLLTALTQPLSHLSLLGPVAGLFTAMLIVGLFLQAVAARAFGRVREGVISRWSLAYIRVWMKTGYVAAAGNWLSGGLYWPIWLRLAGMRIGRRVEISTIIDVVPELVDIRRDTFFADGIYLGGPRIQRNTVTLAPVRLDTDTFLGNHAVVRAGQRLPESILIGISTVADDRVVTPGSSWFGHPPFELPRREIVEVERELTHRPSWIRRVNRLFWEYLRFALPIVLMIVAIVWFTATAALAPLMSSAALLIAGASAIVLGSALLLFVVVFVLKWGLLGRVKPGVHPLWSCWCMRWDFLYVAWAATASRLLGMLEGTLLLAPFLRLLGMKIGKRVVLGRGFAHVVDPDMLDIGDGATVNAMFQAHTFEDRVLKIDHVRVGAYSTLGDASVPLYGADIGEYTYVAPHSVIMKRERLLPGVRYEGAPTRREQASTAAADPAVRAAFATKAALTTKGAGRHRAVARKAASATPIPQPRRAPGRQPHPAPPGRPPIPAQRIARAS